MIDNVLIVLNIMNSLYGLAVIVKVVAWLLRFGRVVKLY